MIIVQGDNGRHFPFSTGLDLTEATAINVIVTKNDGIVNKIARIIDEKTGKCEIIFFSSDLTVSGTYEYQWTAMFADGTRLSSLPDKFTVTPKMNSGNNGSSENINIILDGGEF